MNERNGSGRRGHRRRTSSQSTDMEGVVPQPAATTGSLDEASDNLVPVSVTTTNLTPSGALSGYVSRKLRTALNHVGHRVRSAAVRITDINGPRGGVDKQVRVHLVLEPRGMLVVSERGTDVYDAVSRAAARLKAIVPSALRRQSGNRRRA